MLLVLCGIIGVVVGIPAVMIAIAASTRPRADPARQDRSVRAVEPLALGCVMFLVLALVALIYFGGRW